MGGCIGGVVPSLVLLVSSYRFDSFINGCRAVIIKDNENIKIGSTIVIKEIDLMGKATGIPEPDFRPRFGLLFEVEHVCLACEGMAGGYSLLTIKLLENFDY